MNISLSIMAHPSRKLQAEALYKKLKKFDFSKVSVTWDQINNEWDTGKRALLDNAGSEWHVVLQDDAIICDDFYSEVVNAINNVPETSLISLYTGTVRPFRTRVQNAVKKATGVAWLRSYSLYWGVGIVIPTFHVEPMLEFVEGMIEPYDYRIGMFYRANILPVFYTNPSLVNHDDTIGSLVGNGYAPEPRVAHNFASGPITWNRKFIDI